MVARRPGPLNGPEAEALKELGAQRDDRLALRFVREGLTEGRFLPGLVVRRDYAWQAALGLNRQRRDAAERLLLAELSLDVADCQKILATEGRI